MSQVRFVLMILAIICLFLAALNVATPRGNLMAAGLTLWALSTLLG